MGDAACTCNGIANAGSAAASVRDDTFAYGGGRKGKRRINIQTRGIALTFLSMKAAYSLDVPEDVVTATRMTLEEIRLEPAIALFRLDRLSMGKAAEFAGVPTGNFQNHLASRRTGPHYDVADALKDAAALAALPR